MCVAERPHQPDANGTRCHQRHLLFHQGWNKSEFILNCPLACLCSTLSFHILLSQQYFQIPLASLRAVLSSVDVNTMRLILQYCNRNREDLKVDSFFFSEILQERKEGRSKSSRTFIFSLETVKAGGRRSDGPCLNVSCDQFCPASAL